MQGNNKQQSRINEPEESNGEINVERIENQKFCEINKINTLLDQLLRKKGK